MTQEAVDGDATSGSDRFGSEKTAAWKCWEVEQLDNSKFEMKQRMETVDTE